MPSRRLSVPLALQGILLGVCGNTGSGKSSLVSAILGEVSDCDSRVSARRQGPRDRACAVSCAPPPSEGSGPIWLSQTENRAACPGAEVCDKCASLSPSDPECCLLGPLEVQPHLSPALCALCFGSSQLSG